MFEICFCDFWVFFNCFFLPSWTEGKLVCVRVCVCFLLYKVVLVIHAPVCKSLRPLSVA